MKLVVATRWVPYRCPGCRKMFLRRVVPSAILTLIGFGVGLPLILMVMKYGSTIVFVVALAVVLLVCLSDWLFVPLRETQQKGHGR
jgi:hypothetical protein